MESNEPQIICYEVIQLPDEEKEPGEASEDKSSSSSSDEERESPEPKPVSPATNKDRGDRIRQETIDLILDCIVVPKRFQRNEHTYIRRLSRELASRIEVAQLSKRFEDYLKERQVRMQGYCPVRRELYDLLFDELIRQSTVFCPERGSLLLRVRDEFRLSLAAYEKLLEKGIEYGTRKALEAEVKTTSLQIQHSDLKAEKDRAEKRIQDLRAQMESEEILSQQRIDMIQLRHEERMAFLKKTNKQLKEQLSIIT